MSKVQKSRLGRGLSSLIPTSRLPVEVEVVPLNLAERPLGAPSPDALVPARHAPGTPFTATSPGSTPVSTGTEPPSTGDTSAAASARPMADAASAAGQPLMIPPDSIHPNPHQPRQSMDEAKGAELASSIKSSGIIQPIIVRKLDGNVYQLIAGERRWRAAKLAGLPTVPAIVREVSSYEQAQMALIENIQREDLNPIERAQSYRTLIDQLGLTQAELAVRLGEDRSSIANHLRLLDLNDHVQELVRSAKLTLGHAKLLAGVNDPVEQDRLANLVLSQDLSVRNLERLLANPEVPTGRSRHEASPPSAHLQDLERNLTRQLGLRVQVKSGAKKGRGRLVIHYGSLGQFDGLIARLGVRTADE